MQHMGDLQPLERPFSQGARAPAGRYSAKRSHWRFAIGSLEIGFDRASEQIQAATERRGSGLGERLLILFGMLCVTLLVIALVGWLWSARGPVLGGATVSAAIIDRSPAHESEPLAGRPGVAVPTERPSAFLSAVIEERAPAPAMAPARRAAVPIAQGEAIAPRPMDMAAGRAPAPDESLVQSGNFMLIPNVERAVGLAMGSGEAQNWAAGQYHGLVVVGEALSRAGKSCREGAILLRDGSAQGRTQSFERCL